MRRAGHVACIEERRGAHRVLVGNRKGKRQLGRPCRRWEDNIKTGLQRSVMRWNGLDLSGAG